MVLSKISAAALACAAMLPVASAMSPEECAALMAAGVEVSCDAYAEDKYIDFGHTAFIIVSMALVNLMTPGLAFFYGGLVKESSVITMIMQSWISMGVTTIFWVVIGFTLCFGAPLSGFMGDPSSYPMMANVDGSPLQWEDADGVISVTATGIPGLVFAGYQGMFAVITPALMTGAFADRMRFAPYVLFIILWLLIVYCPVCHWVWGPNGWMGAAGIKDFAGGIVVHATAGFGALAAVFVLGARKPQAGETEDTMDTPHNIPMVALGTGLLWVGWFGFNAGSALNANDIAAFAAINSEISASVALTTWALIDTLRGGKPNMVGVCVGAVAGLATITPAAGFVKPWAAACIGFIAATFCYAMVELRKKMKWDDALDVWGVHGMGGFIGTVCIGVFGSINGAEASGELFGMQLGAVSLVSVYSLILSFGLLKLINLLPRMHLLPTDEELANGLDLSFHGEKAYQIITMAVASFGLGDEVKMPATGPSTAANVVELGIQV